MLLQNLFYVVYKGCTCYFYSLFYCLETEGVLVPENHLDIDSLIPDRAITTRVRDRASDPLSECEIDRVSNWVIESEINIPIEWPIARSWPRLSPVAFHKILAWNRCVQYNVVHYPLTYCHTYTHILSGWVYVWQNCPTFLTHLPELLWHRCNDIH